MHHPIRRIMSSAMFWFFNGIFFLLLALIFIRPVLHVIGVIFGWMGGQGLEGTDL